jgi:SAM-dependent methyltransferase
MPDLPLKPASCILCKSVEHELLTASETPRDGENIFGISDYYRELWRCEVCGLFCNRHRHDLSSIYEEQYGQAAYDYGSQKSRFNAIMNLPAEKSDNRGRVRRVIAYVEGLHTELERSVLDVGCGMAVFPAVMREHGWSVTAIDPNPVSVEHAEKMAKVKAIEGSFPSIEVPQKYTLITFNKVLEHIENFVECLSAARLYLAEGGIVYVELPDGEAAIEAGPDRQEFFLEHYYAFGFSSLALLAKQAGFYVQSMERIIDPSGKRTLFAFLSAGFSFHQPQNKQS